MQRTRNDPIKDAKSREASENINIDDDAMHKESPRYTWEKGSTECSTMRRYFMSRSSSEIRSVVLFLLNNSIF